MKSDYRVNICWILFAGVAGFLYVSCVKLHANVLQNPPYAVDELILREGADALAENADLTNITFKKGGAYLMLTENATSGSAILAPIMTRFPFNEALPSWNGWTPEHGGFEVSMRIEIDGEWSLWFQAGTWGTLDNVTARRVTKMSGLQYDLDTLLLEKPSQRLQFKIVLVRSESRIASPQFRLLAVSCTNSMKDKNIWRIYGDRRTPRSLALDELKTSDTLAVPFRSQTVSKREWIGNICSPVAVCMALEYFGVNRATDDIAGSVYDKQAKMFGIWHRAIQVAAQEGIRGYVRRFRSWDAVREQFKKGYVICASIRFEREELETPPVIYRTSGTGGHLIVITGFAPGGYIITNDSASQRYGAGLLWRQDDLARAWFDKGGVAYVFTGYAR